MSERARKKVRATERRFTQKMQKKLVVLFFLVLSAFVGLSVRLFYIGKNNGKEYEKQVLSQQQYDSTTLPFKRGDILDRNGTVLATSERVYNLIVDAKVILEKDDYLQPTVNALRTCFPALDQTELNQYLNDNKNKDKSQRSQYRIFLKQLTYDEIEPFLNLEEDAEKGANIKGVWFEKEYRRYYPNNTLASDVIGFITENNKGTFGLEEYYNDTLNGLVGREYGYLNDDSILERTVKPAVDGYTVISTIDANVQSIAEKYLNKFMEEYRDSAREGAGANNIGCIIMEVDTGNVLTMASAPGFNLNDPKDISALYTPEEIQAMEEEGTLYDAYNQLWRNFCISDTYEPGSTIKPFTVATALDCGAITGNEKYLCTGKREIGGWPIACHNTYGDGELTVKQAVEKSCNVALMYIAEAAGKHYFCDYQHNFNFGLKTNIDLAGEARTVGLLYSENNMGPTELATCSFGQGFNVTMIQMITGFCSMINGGKYYEPHMVSKVVSQDGSTVQTIEPRVLKQTISPSVSRTIVDYCNGVVTEGTGTTARPAGYAIGGKTGTAEMVPRDKINYVVSFMGYAPAENPQIAIYVVVDRPNAANQDDAKYATKLVRSILTEALPYLGIFMTEEVTEKEQEELDALHLENTNYYRQQAVSGNDTSTAGEGTGEGSETGENGESGEPDGTGEGGTGGTGSGGTEGAGGESGGTAGEGAEGGFVPEIWKTFEKDPDTGNYIDPNTGHQIDPETGHDLEAGSLIGEHVGVAGGGRPSGE